MHGFYRDHDGVGFSLDGEELQILLSLVGDLQGMVAPPPAQNDDPLAQIVGIDETAVHPTDEAMARLFPDAYADDDEASVEFRRFTERGLRERRMEQLQIVQMLFENAGQGPTILTESESQAALGVLNDLRLVLGVRLGIEHDEDNKEDFVASEDPRRRLYVAYQWLTWLQQDLIDSLTQIG